MTRFEKIRLTLDVVLIAFCAYGLIFSFTILPFAMALFGAILALAFIYVFLVRFSPESKMLKCFSDTSELAG